jgi:hypothetical protein
MTKITKMNELRKAVRDTKAAYCAALANFKEIPSGAGIDDMDNKGDDWHDAKMALATYKDRNSD